jgi:hypothetical protein
MHARTVRSEGPAEVLDKLTELIQGQAIPALNTYPGFAGAYWLADRPGGKGAGFFFYETADNLKETAERAGALRESIAQQTGGKITDVNEHEVVADTGHKVHSAASHARVTTLKIDPSRRGEGVKYLNDVVIPTAQGFTGFLGGFWLNDGGTTATGVTLWDGQASLEGSRTMADKLRETSAGVTGSKVISVEEFEIVARAQTPVHA